MKCLNFKGIVLVASTVLAACGSTYHSDPVSSTLLSLEECEDADNCTVIQACVGPQGQVRIVDGPEDCHPSESSIWWGQIGPAGEDGKNSLIHTTRFGPGEKTECPEGGLLVEIGLDLDADGVLDDDEIYSTEYVCDGEQGEQGPAGHDSLIETTRFEASEDDNCPAGGVRIDAGLDENDDGVLDPGEIDSTAYVCDGQSCQPRSCEDMGKSCGLWPDGCGADIDCGTCGAGAVCTPEGTCSGIPVMDTGGYHTCAALPTDDVACWGRNDAGQLGDGTTSNRTRPVYVIGLSGRGVEDISAGLVHTCAVLGSGEARCWGYGGYGQLGNGSGANQRVPVGVSGLENGVQGISAGYNHSCAVMDTGAVKCWGHGGYGKLGHGSTSSSSVPVDVVGIDNAVQVTTGEHHTCALLEDGGVKCWGYGGHGQLGTGSTATRLIPVDVADLEEPALGVSAGQYHTCAVLATGAVKCWGYGNYGQLGNGSNSNQSLPVGVTGLNTDAVRVSAGSRHSCALLLSGETLCWGYNSYGALGDMTTSGRNTPVDVVGLDVPAESISAGLLHTCATLDTGAIRCWGYGSHGQLGDGYTANQTKPVYVVDLGRNAPLRGMVDIAAGVFHTCALQSTGGALCWGLNQHGELGDGTSTSRTRPVSVSGLASGVGIAAGYYHSCVVQDSGTIKCWGIGDYGQLGNGTTGISRTPVDVVGLGGSATKITAGAYNTCAILETGALRCWGDGRFGQLGQGSSASSTTPVDVTGLSSGVTDVASGYYHSCAVLDSGAVKCWGNGGYGKLGQGSSASSTTPVDVVGLASGAVSVVAGYQHTCALLDTGAVQCWGYGGHGQLGNGSTASSLVPVTVTGVTDAVRIVAGELYTCAVLDNGAMKCWGYGGYGQLGNGSTANQFTPSRFWGMESGTATLTAGAQHTCGLTDIGTAICAGRNNYGALGNGTTSSYSAVGVYVLP